MKDYEIKPTEYYSDETGFVEFLASNLRAASENCTMKTREEILANCFDLMNVAEEGRTHNFYLNHIYTLQELGEVANNQEKKWVLDCVNILINSIKTTI